MTEQNTLAGIWIMIATTMIFAVQDGLSRHLAGDYNVYMVVAVRYWFFAAFVIALAARRGRGLRAAFACRYPKIHILRAFLLVAEVLLVVQGFVYLGLVESHAIFTASPLIVAALSGPLLGERVGWRHWIAIGAGALGVLIILQPGSGAVSPYALLPLAGAAMFALYGLLTRYVARGGEDAMVSFSVTGVLGAAMVTPLGLWHWQAMSGGDWVFMALLCCTGALSHGMLIRAYDIAEAGVLQPFSYLQVVWSSLVGIFVFNEVLRANVATGAAVVVAAGLFALMQSRRQSLSGREAPR